MKVLVLWAKPSATNLGIRVLAEGASRLALEAFGSDAEVIFHDHDTPGTPLGKRAIMRDILNLDGGVRRILREFDVVYDTGSGDSYCDIYGLRRLAVMVYAHLAAKRAGVPLVLGVQTIGPFNTRIGRLLARRSLRAARIVLARDSVSAEYAEALRRKPNAVTSDVVFILPAPSPSAASGEILVNVSGLLWRPNSHCDHLKYRADVHALCDELVRRGALPVLFPHVLRSAVSREDDVTAVEEAAALLKGSVLAWYPSSLDEVRSRMAAADAVVGARMHACLNALSVGTPALAWSYSRKFAPLLADIGWGHVLSVDEGELASVTANQVLGLAHDRKAAERVAATARDTLKRAAQTLSTVIP